MNISDILIQQKDNEKCALIFENESLSYKDWYKESQSLSAVISKISPEESCTIVMFLPNSINYAVAFFAVQFCEKTLVPIFIEAKAQEIISTIEYAESDLIITDSCHMSYIEECALLCNNRLIILNVDTQEWICVNEKKRYVDKSADAKRLVDEEVALLLHTSGTTSYPKRVMLSHQNLLANIKSNIKSLKLTATDKTLITLPMVFGYCNTSQFLTHAYLGATIVIYDGVFFSKKFFKIVEKEKITNYTCVPSILFILADYRHRNKYNYSSLKIVCFGGGAMPISKLSELISKYPSIGFVQTYGQTEASPRVTALLPQDAVRKIGSVGCPIPGVAVKIADDNGVEVQQGQIGEILINGDNVMKGYFKREEITKNTVKNGWLYSGDLGFKDSEGYIYLIGRKKNIIITNGINVYPEEVEEVLRDYPGVVEALVEGEYDVIRGEVPVAQMISNKEIDLDEVRKYCSSRLPLYKVPQKILIVEKLKKTITGKIKRGG